jgi:hypothetical protein
MTTTISGSTGVNLTGTGNQVAFPDSSVQTTAATGFGFKNAIINGDFDVNQRAVSGTVTLAASVYGHDRWKAGASGCTYTFATSNNITTLTISAGSLIQVIEGLNLQSGTYTLSWTGTAQGKIGAGSYSATGVTGSATGGTNLNIEFGTGTISLIQFEKGSTATAFDFRSIGTELILCQRYYEIGAIFPIGLTSSGGNFGTTVKFSVLKRASPTLSQTNTSAVNLSTSPSNTGTGNAAESFASFRSGGTGGACQYSETWTASAEL